MMILVFNLVISELREQSVEERSDFGLHVLYTTVTANIFKENFQRLRTEEGDDQDNTGNIITSVL